MASLARVPTPVSVAQQGQAPRRVILPVGPRRGAARAVLVRAAEEMESLRMYPDPKFVEMTKMAFPDKAIADAEEARVLLDDGYVVLDVRSNFAREEGPMKNSYHAPLCVAKKRWDPETKSRVYDYEDVDIYEEWLPRVQKVIPDKSTKIIVMSADGRERSIRALELLDEAGYNTLVGLKGGFLLWNMTWDNKLNRRVYTEYKEDYYHEADSCGIHASGAGFSKMDPLEFRTEIIH